MDSEARNPYLIPLAIIIAGALIAAAVLLTTNNKKLEVTPPPQSINLQALREIRSGEHFRGDAKTAEVVIVEYSDLECPYCKAFHEEMLAVMADPELSGKVAWVFRHFPIDSNHSKARNEAEASECAAELGGNAAFWAYTDRLFEVTPTNDGLDPAELPKIASTIGLDPARFSTCLSEQKYQSKIQADYQNAVDIGGRGTPFNLAIGKNGKVTPIGGYASAAQLKAIIKNLF